MAATKQPEKKPAITPVTPVKIQLPTGVERSVKPEAVAAAIQSGVRIRQQSWTVGFTPVNDHAE
jgi:hypothetical protein